MRMTKIAVTPLFTNVGWCPSECLAWHYIPLHVVKLGAGGSFTQIQANAGDSFCMDNCLVLLPWRNLTSVFYIFFTVMTYIK